jgi:valyl-tRNA synthetase
MDDDYYRAVIRVFVDLYKKGYIYRGLRMINWDTEAKTALSNEEVIYNEEGEKATLYKIRYKLEEGDDEWVTVATVRPETIMGDTAIAVNPKDDRYKHLVGKRVLVPLINRSIPVIGDDYVDMEFGTGCLKITPAHDPNDYEIGLKHNLEVIDTINDDGSLNEKCEIDEFIGLDRFEVRKRIIKKLTESGNLLDREDFITRIGRSERTNSIVEPKLSLQWFIKMKEISHRAYRAVEDDEIRLYPSKFKNTYRHWMENVRDWCISRQLWWGHRIPAYFYGDGENDFVVAESLEEAVELAQEASGNSSLTSADLKQDEDVLDTWASSWLWPIQVFNGLDEQYFDKESGKIKPGTNKELDYFYPTKVLVTAPEILFFWVARMIIAGYEYTDKKPFEDVYLTGIVRDKQRRKMSKSLGNSPDPLELMEKYSADGVRTGMLFSSPAGNDLLFDEKLCEQGRNFANKIWNAFRLINSWETDDQLEQPASNQIAVEWFQSRLNQAIDELEDHFSKYRISDALMTIYKLIWDDFASWYLELVKPSYEQPIDADSREQTILFLESLIRLLHPFMPFLTEEIWHKIREREDDYIVVSEWPEAGKVDEQILGEAPVAFELITNIRSLRTSKNIPNKTPLKLHIRTKHREIFTKFEGVIAKLANLEEFRFVDEKESNSAAFVVKGHECFIPLEGNVDAESEKDQIMKELEYTRGFLASVNKKLQNDRFVNNAPEKVVETEKKKQADAEAKIKALESALASL